MSTLPANEGVQREQYSASIPADSMSSERDATEELERLAAPLLAIERGLPLLSRLLAQ
ncbi:MAG: hypothetical protein J2P36_39305 [Ktedonobacteraceae bacterium]|nr:hypothetical protein [Ktedonobacteraceae bacterium]